MIYTIKKTYVLFLSVFVMSFADCLAQDMVSRPSPNNQVSSVGGGDLVSLYTGELNLNIPLLSLESKEGSVPVSLQYIAGGGVKVQDYASIVGLGWKLNAGGKITRTVRGYPDEHANGYLGTKQWGKSLRNAVVANPTNPNFPTQLYSQVGATTLDTEGDGEPDLYFIETPLFSAYFTFDENGNAVFLSENGMKVITQNFYNTSNYSDSKFLVIDPSGNQYYFALNGSRELSQYYEHVSSSKKSYVSSWYLDKIISGTRRDTVDIEYQDFNPLPVENILLNGFKLLNTNEFYYQYSSSKTTLQNFPIHSPNYQYVTSTSRVRSLYTKSIKSSLGKIEFEYSKGRQDHGAPQLNSIILFNKKSNLYKRLKTYSFSYSYFGSNSANNHLTKRLSLENIKYCGQGQSSANARTYYSFTYNRNKHLPSRDSDQHDYFGFYTKTDTSIFSYTTQPLDNSYSREPLFKEYITANVLQAFTNELGEETTVDYELKTISGYNIYAPYQYANGLRVKTIKKKSNNTQYTTSFEYDFNGVSAGRIIDPSFKTIFLNANYINNAVWRKDLSHSEGNMMDLLSPKVGYSKVKTINHDGTSRINEFYNYNDYPDYLFDSGLGSYQGGATVLSSISKVQKRGLPKKDTYYNATGIAIKITDFEYTTIGSVQKNSYGLKNYVNLFKINIGSSSHTGVYLHKTLYWNETENYRLTKVIDKVYNSSLDKYIQSVQNITYNASPYSWQIRSSTASNADGSTEKVTSYYPNNLNNIPLLESGELFYLDYLIADNIVSPAVHQDVEINGKKVSASHKYLLYPFKIGATSDYVYKAGVPTKISESLYAYSGGNLVLTENESKERASLAYHDNLLTVEISNASAVGTSSSPNKHYEFYYEGFEHLNTSNNYAGNGSSTVPFQVPFVKPNSRKYLIDYRYRNSLGKWVYVKGEYTNNMILNPNGTRIDEIRVYPIDSRIKTMVNEPLVGLVSETNSLGHTIFYEYDEHQRLKVVRDQDGNILKTYEYNY